MRDRHQDHARLHRHYARPELRPRTTHKTALSPWKIPFTALAVLFYALFALYIWRVVLRIRGQKQHLKHFKPNRKERKKTAQ